MGFLTLNPIGRVLDSSGLLVMSSKNAPSPQFPQMHQNNKLHLSNKQTLKIKNTTNQILQITPQPQNIFALQFQVGQ